LVPPTLFTEFALGQTNRANCDGEPFFVKEKAEELHVFFYRLSENSVIQGRCENPADSSTGEVGAKIEAFYSFTGSRAGLFA